MTANFFLMGRASVHAALCDGQIGHFAYGPMRICLSWGTSCLLDWFNTLAALPERHSRQSQA